ncbi:hypothetical protein OQA88_9960 [Cercophora sp. LCS_1]
MPSAIFLLVPPLLYLAYRITHFALSTLRPPNFPPGPPVLPLLGHIHLLPFSKSFLTFAKWSRQYGPILGLKFGPLNVVVLSTPSQVRHLFQLHSATYSARPYMAIPCDYVFTSEWSHHPGFMSIPFQRAQQKACHHHLSSAGLAQLVPIQRTYATILLGELATHPFEECFHRWTLGVACALISGTRLAKLGHNWAAEYHNTQKKLLELLEPGGVAPPIDIFPFLAWIPERWAVWKRKARGVRTGVMGTYQALFENAKRGVEAQVFGGKYEPLLARLLRERSEGKGEFTERDIALIGGGLLDGASHTTVGTALYLVQALAAHPEAQRRAQAEVDGVFGREHWPSEDFVFQEEQFPYLRACVLEVLRWRPTAPNGVPRECVADAENVFGYRIPKGTMIMFNVWAIHHNPDEYDEPEEYIPERWLGNRLGTKHAPEMVGQGGELSWRKPSYTFGAGRRSCQGEQFAVNSIHITFVLILWAFDIVPEGELDLSVETGMHEGAAISPNPFKVRFVPRSDKVLREIEKQHSKAVQTLAELLP